MGIHATFALANRTAIEDEIERLIALLDGADAPNEDLEPETDFCLAGDDGCGQALSMAGGVAWGSPEEAGGTALPRYGPDQSAGPINRHEAAREHTILQLGLVRTATGWRRP